MSKVAVIYWTGTGNTEEMANIVVSSVRDNGAEASLINCSDFNDNMIDSYDTFAFGCPAMGAEELEDSEFEPMFADCEDKLRDKKVGIFGSYGWGDGEWMRTWEDRCKAKGMNLVCNGVICNGAPDDEAKAALKDMAKALAK